MVVCQEKDRHEKGVPLSKSHSDLSKGLFELYSYDNKEVLTVWKSDVSYR